MKEGIRSRMYEIEMRGKTALFSDPVLNAGGEKCSLPVPTYEAVKGAAKRIMWKPTFIWYVDELRVMNRIRREPRGIRTLSFCKPDGSDSDLSVYSYLTDVCYQARLHYEWNMNQPYLAGDRDFGKFDAMIERAIAAGGRFSAFLGSSECGCEIRPCRFGEGSGYYDEAGTMDFGTMFHGITYCDEAVREEDRGYDTKRFWHAVMEDGVIRFPRPEECTKTVHFREGNMRCFGKEKEEDSELV